MKHGETDAHSGASEALTEAAQERAEAQRIRRERIRRGSVWLGAVVLFGLLLGLMLGRLVNPLTPPWTPAQVLAVLAEPHAEGWRLRLQLSRSVTYRRTQQPGALSLTLNDVQLTTGERRGHFAQQGVAGSWQIVRRGADVQVLLVSLSGALKVDDRWHADAEQGWLTLQVLPETAP